MNKTAKEAAEFVKALIPSRRCPGRRSCRRAFVCLPDVIKAVEGSNIKVAAQNMHWEERVHSPGKFQARCLRTLGWIM